MADQETVLVLRDGEGNFYLISTEALEAGKLPEDKKAILEQALPGDVAGFFFDANFQSALTAVNQNNSASAVNFGGGLSVLSPQTITQLQGNIANVNTSQRARA